jgi:aryl-alcohol dehydrogenase-like predicted oxidoreductase
VEPARQRFPRRKVPTRRAGRRAVRNLELVGESAFEKRTERNWRTLDVLLEAAKELGRPPAEVALNWVATQPGVSSTIIGATKMSQLESNLRALEFTIPAEVRARLDEASKLERAHPYVMFDSAPFPEMINGGVPVRGWA